MQLAFRGSLAFSSQREKQEVTDIFQIRNFHTNTQNLDLKPRAFPQCNNWQGLCSSLLSDFTSAICQGLTPWLLTLAASHHHSSFIVQQRPSLHFHPLSSQGHSSLQSQMMAFDEEQAGRRVVFRPGVLLAGIL